MLPSPDGVWPIRSGSSENDPLHLSSQTLFLESDTCSASQLPGKAKCVCSLSMLQMYTEQLLVLAGK